MKDASTTFADVFNGAAQKMPTRPRRPRLLQFYSSLYYEDHIKADFDKEWERILDLPEEERGTEDPVEIVMRNEFTLKRWEAESQATKDLVKRKLELFHQQAIDTYNVLRKTSKVKGPEDYHM